MYHNAKDIAIRWWYDLTSLAGRFLQRQSQRRKNLSHLFPLFMGLLLVVLGLGFIAGTGLAPWVTFSSPYPHSIRVWTDGPPELLRGGSTGVSWRKAS